MMSTNLKEKLEKKGVFSIFQTDGNHLRNNAKKLSDQIGEI